MWDGAVVAIFPSSWSNDPLDIEGDKGLSGDNDNGEEENTVSERFFKTCEKLWPTGAASALLRLEVDVANCSNGFEVLGVELSRTSLVVIMPAIILRMAKSGRRGKRKKH